MNEITKTVNNLTAPSTVEQEQIAKDEQQIGIFFSAYAIQYVLHKEMLQNKLSEPTFLRLFGDIETCVLQRVFIKNLLANRSFIKVAETLRDLHLDFFYNPERNPHPYLMFLSKINKTFLIRQIFNHSGQILERYKFINDFLDNKNINMDDLYSKMWHLSIEQQIIILARIYGSLTDEMHDKKKTIAYSFHENILRLKDDSRLNPERYQAIQVSNLIIFDNFIKTII